MTELSKNWLTEKHIDFEYKKYLLLAYLQDVKKKFDATKLYPWLAEIIQHYKEALAVKENKQNLQKNFPQKISGINSGGLTFENLLSDDELLHEIEQIVEFAIPQFETRVEEGKSIYDIVEEHLSILPVGIIPLKTECGYIFLKGGKSAETNAYEYQITFWETASEKYKAIHTHFIRAFEKNISSTFQSMKSDLMRGNKLLPNPAAYAIESELSLPLEETFLPVAKRMLVRYLSQEPKKES
ncbi:MAG: hypothetical protein HY063_02995 [Bacteroidetes bacterium]|nr:hypothetical protein [Bacteroidota bacterium]